LALPDRVVHTEAPTYRLIVSSKVKTRRRVFKKAKLSTAVGNYHRRGQLVKPLDRGDALASMSNKPYFGHWVVLAACDYQAEMSQSKAAAKRRAR
jgi:hypothetical protein